MRTASSALCARGTRESPGVRPAFRLGWQTFGVFRVAVR